MKWEWEIDPTFNNTLLVTNNETIISKQFHSLRLVWVSSIVYSFYLCNIIAHCQYKQFIQHFFHAWVSKQSGQQFNNLNEHSMLILHLSIHWDNVTSNIEGLNWELMFKFVFEFWVAIENNLIYYAKSLRFCTHKKNS